MVLFADDNNILIIDKNIDAVEERLSRLTKQFEVWFSNNIFTVKTDKTKAVLFHLNKTCNLVMPKIVFKNVEISYTSEVKFLGINTYLLTPWCRVLLEQLTGLQLVKKVPAFHGTQRFITALTSTRHLSLSCASPIQSIYQHPTSWRYVLIF